MSNQISNSFIDQWGNEVKHAYQQKKAKLRKAIREVSGVVGSTHKFHTIGTVTANTKTRDADVTPLNATQAVKTATLADAYAPLYIDKLDLLKTNADFRREYVMASASALGRKTDEIIVAAMDASNTQIGTTAGGFTYVKLLEALEGLNSVDADAEDRCLVVGPKQVTAALQITNLTSADYSTLRAVMSGEIGTALGFTWIMSNRLSLNVAVRSCFGIAKSSVGLAIGQDVSTEINYVPEKVSYLVNSYLSMGAVTIEATGVQEIPCTE